MEEERPFYCYKADAMCPFESRFRYCFENDCPRLQEKIEREKDKENKE